MTMTGCSARSAWTTSSTTCCPRTGGTGTSSRPTRPRPGGGRNDLLRGKDKLVTEARRRLDQPKAPRGLRRPHISQEAVGSAAETIARFFGTARYLFLQTLIVI